MKTLLTLFFIICLTSCKKELPVDQRIIGTWEYRGPNSTPGGFGLEFTESHLSFIGGIDSGWPLHQYKILKERRLPFLEYDHVILFGTNFENIIYVGLKDDELLVSFNPPPYMENIKLERIK